MKKTKIKTATAEKYPNRSSDVPVTQKMLYGVRAELKAHTDSRFHELKAEISSVKSEISSVQSGTTSLRSEIKAEVSALKSQIHNLTVLIEEQNARNIIVLDGLGNLFYRQDRVETEWDSFKKTYSR